MGSTGVVEEQISSELVLVDQELAQRARAKLPDPPWLLPVLAELRDRPPPEPARPRRPRRRPRVASVIAAVAALVAVAVLGLAFVPLSRGPSFATTPVRQAAPTVPLRPPTGRQSKPETKPKTTQTRAATTTRQSKRPATKPRTKPKARVPKPAPVARPLTLTPAQRMVAWSPSRAAAYYQIYLQRGGRTLYQAQTLRTSTTLPARLTLRPGLYSVVVHSAIPSDSGIILGPVVYRETLRLR